MANDGTLLQSTFQEALAALQQKSPAMWHRFLDSKAARTLVKEQPGDFMLIYLGVPHLFELKSTDCGVSLKKLMQSQTAKRQSAQARKWERAGGKAWIVYGDLEKGIVEFHTSGLGRIELVGKLEGLAELLEILVARKSI